MPRRAQPSRSDPSTPAETGPGPRERLLLAGERLFADHGMGVGVREITAEAGVNLAALNYYFGSKEGLLEAVFEARARPVAEARLALLAACGEGAGRPPVLHQVLAAYLRPALMLNDPRSGGGAFTRLRARITVEQRGLAQRIQSRAFDESSRAFLDALGRLLPGLPPAELAWRFHFLLGAMFYCMADNGRIAVLTQGRFDTHDAEQGLACLVTFLAAGFVAGPTPAASTPSAGRQGAP